MLSISGALRAMLRAATVLATSLAAAATQPCPMPPPLGDGWHVASDAAAAGFVPNRLCDAVAAFTGSGSNLHALVVARRGVLVAEHYRDGKDASTYTLFPRMTHFDAATRHDVRSVTKSVLALLWGIAQAEGRTPALQTPVLDLLPALADLKTAGRERITVEDLWRMRSGLDWKESGSYRRWGNDEFGLMWRGDIARYVLDRPMVAPAGRLYNYNGGSTAVLGLLLAERVGMPLPDYARRKLFEPLGIHDWEWVGDLRGRTRAHAGLRLRPRDLAKLGRLVLDGGSWQGRSIVPAAWLRASFDYQAPNAEYGHHWWLGVVWAGGKSYSWRAAMGNGGQRLFLVPALDLAVVITAGEYDNGGIGRELTHLLSLIVGAVSDGGAAPAPAATAAEAASGVGAGATAAAGVGASAAATEVYTRATVQSIETDSAKRLLVRLKLLPRQKIPFSTLSYRVADPALVAGLQPGDNVAFRAERIDGENTVVAIRPAAPCVRFQDCK